MLDILVKISTYLAGFGYWGIGIGMALESACIPLPSEVILPFGGYLAGLGKLKFTGVVLAGTVGGTVGSIFAYYIGSKLGRPFLKKYGRYFFISERKLSQAEYWFIRYGDAAVFFTRLMPVVRTFISLPAGIFQMNFKKFVVYTFMGSLPWSLALVYAGKILGHNWKLLEPIFRKFDIFLLILLIFIVICYLFWSKKHSKS